jgi:hypothetical protein
MFNSTILWRFLMKMFKRLTWFLFVALFLLVGSAASASASTLSTNQIWAPTQESGVEFKFGPEDNYSLYVDFLGSIEDEILLIGSGYSTAFMTFENEYSSVTITQCGSKYSKKSYALSGGPNFIFSIFEGDEMKVKKDLHYLQIVKDNYSLGANEFSDQIFGTFMVHDVVPLTAPVPAAIILFGSGLLGLVGLKRRNY